MPTKTEDGDSLTGEHGWAGEKVGLVQSNHGGIHDGRDELLANG